MKFAQNPTPFRLGEHGFRQVAFDGKYYYFTFFSQKKILKTTKDFFPLEHILTCRVYDCLCYDYKLCCFWGSVSGCCSRIFQLNMELEEISCVCLPQDIDVIEDRQDEVIGDTLGMNVNRSMKKNIFSKRGGTITGLSYHPCHDSIFIAYPWGVAEYDKNEKKWCLTLEISGVVTSICAVCPGLLVITRQGTQQTIHSFFDTGVKIKEYSLPSPLSVRSFLYQPCNGETPYLDFFFTQGGCYPQMLREPITAYELGFEPCFCNFEICEKICCPITPCNPVEDVLESIALVESALSHILNAQGEQLQKVVAESCTVEEMLRANEKINETITKVTHLEMLLHNKLEALWKLCPTEVNKEEDSVFPNYFP